MRAVITPNGRFTSVADAARAHGITPPTGKRRVELKTHGWSYDETEEPVIVEWRKFFAISGEKRSIRDAFIAGYNVGRASNNDAN